MAAAIVCQRALQKLRSFAHFNARYCQLRHRTNSSTGAYFIFIPEVPKDTRESNPIMRYEEFPDYKNITQAKIIRGCAKLALEFDSQLVKMLEKCKENPEDVTFDGVFGQIESTLAPMNYAEYQATVLALTNFVKFPKSMLDRVQMQMDRSRKDRFDNDDLYELLMYFNSQRDSLTEYQRRLLDMYLFECKITGSEVTNEKDLNLVQTQLRKEYDKQIEFLDKVSKHRSLFYLDLGPQHWDFVRQLPKHVRHYIAQNKAQPDRGPWKVTLWGYVIDSFLEICPRRDFRQYVWNANVTVGTHIKTDIRLHTFEIPGEIRECRRDIAGALGYEHFAEMSMEHKMAGNVQTVLSMIDMYRNYFFPTAKKEIKSLQKFAASRGLKDSIKQWDIPYYRRLQCQALFGMHNVDRLPFFTFDLVQEKLYSLCEKLFGIKIEALDLEKEGVSVWHPDVTAYNVYDQNDTYLSRFYIDPYGRQGEKLRKDSTEICRDRCDTLDMTPITNILLNLEKHNVQGVPALMSYKDVLSFFYHFGHALQQMLTTVPYSEMAGQKYIEWDAAHVVAHVMKMFALQPEFIRDISAHHQTGEILSDEQIYNLLRCQMHLKAFDMCYELYKSAFDIECHLKNETYWKDIQTEMYKLFMPLPLDQDDWSWCSDSTIWVGTQHSAGYYQYIWSEMLAANIFEVFEEAGFDNEKQLAKVGMRFRDTYLSLGGAVQGKVVFRQMTGRDPSFESLLKRYPKAEESSE